jgi:hypothetical protein
MKKNGKSAVAKNNLSTNEELVELREMLLNGLKISSKRMIAEKKKLKLKLAVAKDGKVVLIDPATV